MVQLGLTPYQFAHKLMFVLEAGLPCLSFPQLGWEVGACVLPFPESVQSGSLAFGQHMATRFGVLDRGG